MTARWLLHRPLVVQFSLFAGVGVLVVVALLYSLHESAAQWLTLQRAREVGVAVAAAGARANGPGLDKHTADLALDGLAGSIGDMPTRVRLAGDQVTDPARPPDRFERTALARMRGDSGLTEYHEISGHTVFYARRLGLTQGGRVPQRGDVDIVSIWLPIRRADAGTICEVLGGQTWAALVALVVCGAALLLWTYRCLLRPVAALTIFANRALSADLHSQVPRVELDPDELSSRSELHMLSVALKALYRGLRLRQSDRA